MSIPIEAEGIESLALDWDYSKDSRAPRYPSWPVSFK